MPSRARLVAKLLNVPFKLDPGLDAVARGAQSPLVPLPASRDQSIEQLSPIGPWDCRHQLDVPLDVVDEMTQRILVLPCAREGLLKSLTSPG